jgi:hypothetical protein
MKTLALLSALLLAGSMVRGQATDPLRVKGFVDTYHAVRWKNPNDFLASRSRFRAEIEKISGDSYFFVSMNAMHNRVVPELTSITFREAFMEFTGQGWGFKAGRQIIIWGQADGMKITDVISPMDLSEFLAQDYDDIRMPVNALTLSRFTDFWQLELVCVPLFESYILPGKDNPWALDLTGGMDNVVVEPAVEPEFLLKNMEYGGKLAFYLSGIDLEFSALHTWNKMPVYRYQTGEEEEIQVVPEHHRMGFVGFGFSKSLSAFILRGESAFYFGRNYSQSFESMDEGLPERNSINYLLGIDCYLPGEWMLSGQFSDEWILDHTNAILNPEHRLISTLAVSKKLLRSNLKLATFAYFELQEGSFFSRTSADYALSDNIHVSTGVDWFHGDSGTFGLYQDNSQVWVKAKYSF